MTIYKSLSFYLFFVTGIFIPVTKKLLFADSVPVVTELVISGTWIVLEQVDYVVILQLIIVDKIVFVKLVRITEEAVV